MFKMNDKMKKNETYISLVLGENKDATCCVYNFTKENINQYVKDSVLTEKGLEVMNQISFHEKDFLEALDFLTENIALKVEIRFVNNNDKPKIYIIIYVHSKEGIIYTSEYSYTNGKKYSDDLYYILSAEEEFTKEQKEEIFLDLKNDEKMNQLREEILSQEIKLKIYEIHDVDDSKLLGVRNETFVNNKLIIWTDLFKISENSKKLLNKITGEEDIITIDTEGNIINIFE